MTWEQIRARIRQWSGGALSEAEYEEWDRLDEEAETVLTEAERVDAFEEGIFPLEALNLPDEDHARLRDFLDGEGLPHSHQRIMFESLRRRIAAKKGR